MRDGGWGWGAVGQDLNDDGHRDLFQVNGFRELGGQYGQTDAKSASFRFHFDGDPNRLFLGNPDGAWPEAAALVGIDDRTNGKGVVAFDADGDGDLDLVLTPTEDPPVMYRNDTPAGPTTHRLTIRLRQPTGANRFAIGAVVLADLGDGQPPRRLQVHGSGSFQSGDPTDLHLGLGSVASIPASRCTGPTASARS
ncbi:MAG: FG-GAP-like repeat-containing protein [Acidimicrobiales bacterium]